MKRRLLMFWLVLMSLSAGMQARTVVGIHGFMSDTKSLWAMRDTLEGACFNVCLWEYDSKAFTFQCHATHLVNYLNCIASQAPGEPIDFVTHSTGALILRCALNLPNCPNEAKCGRAVLIAPPNKGSKLARKFHNNPLVRATLGPNSGRELMTYCPEDILCLGSFPSTMSVLVLAGCRGIHLFFDGPNDKWVEVDETYLETPHYHHTFFLTHSSLLLNLESRQWALEFLCGNLCHN